MRLSGGRVPESTPSLLIETTEREENQHLSSMCVCVHVHARVHTPVSMEKSDISLIDSFAQGERMDGRSTSRGTIKVKLWN